MSFAADPNRYGTPGFYRRAGTSGVLLPKISLGLWHNFGGDALTDTMKEIVFAAFDRGITHFDLANNYGPPPGAAERNFGALLKTDLKPYRDELFLSTKAGYAMWDGVYGDFGSKKSLVASADQSLKRLNLDYVDVFYHHRYDKNTPLEETADALETIVRSGKALYAGVSNYPAEKLVEMAVMLKERRVPFLLDQPRYNLLNRGVLEGALENAVRETGVGCAVFSPLAGGLLTDRYVDGVPAGSRASENRFLKPEQVEKTRKTVEKLREIALERGEPLSVTALAWALKNPVVTTVLIGASRVGQLKENLTAAEAPAFSDGELAAIDRALAETESCSGVSGRV